MSVSDLPTDPLIFAPTLNFLLVLKLKKIAAAEIQCFLTYSFHFRYFFILLSHFVLFYARRRSETDIFFGLMRILQLYVYSDYFILLDSIFRDTRCTMRECLATWDKCEGNQPYQGFPEQHDRILCLYSCRQLNQRKFVDSFSCYYSTGVLFEDCIFGR